MTGSSGRELLNLQKIQSNFYILTRINCFTNLLCFKIKKFETKSYFKFRNKCFLKEYNRLTFLNQPDLKKKNQNSFSFTSVYQVYF